MFEKNHELNDTPFNIIFYRLHDTDEPKCLTCGDQNCSYSFSKIAGNGLFMIQFCLGPIGATYYLWEIVRTSDASKREFCVHFIVYLE